MRKCWPSSVSPWRTSREWAARRFRRNRTARTSRTVVQRIAWTGQAKADVRAVDRQTAMRILHGLARFTQTEEGDVKRLQDIEPPEFRLRVGAYRIRFTIPAIPWRSSPSNTGRRPTAEE